MSWYSRYQDFSLPGIFAPRQERKFPRTLLLGTKVPGNEMYPGTFVPRIVGLLSDHSKGCWRCSESKSKNIVK